MKKVICDVCGSTMKHTNTIKSSEKYRMRRFECVCGFKQTVFADGYLDLELEPIKAEKAVTKLFKQEEEARNG